MTNLFTDIPLTKKNLVVAAQALNQWYFDKTPKPPTGKLVAPIKNPARMTVEKLKAALLKPDVMFTGNLPEKYTQVLSVLLLEQPQEEPPANPQKAKAQGKKGTGTKASGKKGREKAEKAPQGKKIAKAKPQERTIVLRPDTRHGVFAAIIAKMNGNWVAEEKLYNQMHALYRQGGGSKTSGTWHTQYSLQALHALGIVEGKVVEGKNYWRKVQA
jgi:hypothetical protein